MSGWRERVPDLLYDGEEIRDSVDVETSTVVVTSHRVLVFTPDGDSSNFRQVDRPNIDGVSTGTRNETNRLARGVRYGVVGTVLVIAGAVIDLDSLLDGVSSAGQSTGGLGLGGVMGTLQSMIALLTRLDELLQVVGALVLVLSVALLAAYWHTRERTLVIEVAGDDDIHVPRPAGVSGLVDRLQTAVAPDPAESEQTARGPRREP
jgi:hypothetical protein